MDQDTNPPAGVDPAEQTPPPPTEIQQPPDGSAPVAAPVPVTAPPAVPDPDGVVVPENETAATVTSPGDPGYDELVAEAERQQQRARDLEVRE